MKQSLASSVYLLAYVDDIMITNPSSPMIDDGVAQLKTALPLKDPENLHYFLGISVTKTASGLLLSQENYIRDILNRASMLEAKSLPTPITASTVLSAFEGSPYNPMLYTSTAVAL